MVFHWSLRNNKSPQVSHIILSIQADLDKFVVWMVSTRPLISKSFSLCTSHLMTASSALTTIVFNVTFMFDSFLSSRARSTYLSLFLISFSFTQWSVRTAKSTIRQVLIIIVIIPLFGFNDVSTFVGYLMSNPFLYK